MEPMYSHDDSPMTAERRVRIVHIQLLPILSGVQRVSLEEFAALDERVFERHLICQSAGTFTVEAEKLGVHCHEAGLLQREISAGRDFQAYRQLQALLREIHPDIVHTHSSKTGLLGRLAAKRVNVPVILHTVHGFAFPSAKSYSKRKVFQACEYFAGRASDAVICLNEADEETTRGLLRVPKHNVFRIPNGICLDRFREIANDQRRVELKRERLSFRNRPFVISVGRLWEQKNPELFVRAACELASEGFDVDFAIVGDGPLKPRLNQIIQDANVGDRVHLLGWRDDVSDLLPLADAFVLSSNWEGMPLVLLEANACGVPAIATNVPGSRDCIIDGTTGLLARPNDQNDLKEKIKFLLMRPEVRAEMARRCREHVEEFHDIADRQRSMLNLYVALLKRKNMAELANQIEKVGSHESGTADRP